MDKGGLQRGLQGCHKLQEVCKGVCKVATNCRRSAKGFTRLPQIAGGLQSELQGCCKLQEVCNRNCKIAANLRKVCNRNCKIAANLRKVCNRNCKVAANCRKFAIGFVSLWVYAERHKNKKGVRHLCLTPSCSVSG